MKKLKKLVTLIAGLALTAVAQAGSADLTWDYDFTENPDVVEFRLFAVPGTNTTFTANNANATFVVVSPYTGSKTGVVTNITATIKGVGAGAWTFTATARTANGIESSNADPVWAVIKPGKPVKVTAK